MSPKSRRSQKRGAAEEARPRPRLHAHHRIKSDPVRVEPPLTIDQHLSNYHQSLRSSPLGSSSTASERHTAVRFNFPLPLSSTARSAASSLKKLNSSSPIPMINIQQQKHQETSTPSPTLSHSSSSTSLPSIHHIIDDTNMSSRATSPDNISNNNISHDKEDTTATSTTSTTTTNTISVSPSNSTSNLFYQHRPLTFTRPQNSNFPFTLLHPVQAEEDSNVVRNRSSGKEDEDNNSRKDDPMDEDEDTTKDSKSPSSGGLLQLAHIVSTFG